MLGSFNVLRTTRGSALATLALVAAIVAGCAPGEQADTAGKPAAEPASGNPVVVMKTSKGDIEIELFADKAPLSVKNFFEYADAGHYDGTMFHRVIKDFMIQGGGFTPDGMQKPNRPPIKNEATNGLKNERGTVAMARTSVVDSATSQFFINHADNAFLDHKAATPSGFGYAVFGKVTKGMDVVDAIASTPTADRGGAFQNRPTEDVIIQSVKRK